MANQNGLPAHIGIIMDGNGRWAKARSLPRNVGHKKGTDALTAIVRHAAKIGIQYLTVYAFSTENWKRPEEEVSGLFKLLREYLSNAERYSKDNIRVRLIGERARLPEDVRVKAAEIEQRTGRNTGMVFNIAFNYGGREEIVHAAKALVAKVQSGEITDLNAVTEQDFAALLYTAGQPDVDLIIRTSGEQRISNFLLWQGAYAEYVFVDALWPDFTPSRFDEALESYASRHRRMGGI